MPAKRPARHASPGLAPSLASQLLRSAQHRRCPCRSRLAGEEARKTCIAWAGVFAGKPAPTVGTASAMPL
ncbi:hypothetical protein CW358_14785 [Pseudomonas protegens]|nr:hypothetical protein CW358_14785 [Pseudomonas protegens]